MKYIILLSPLFLGVVAFEFYNYFETLDINNILLAFISSIMILNSASHEYTSEQIEFSKTARFFISTCFATLPFLVVYLFYPTMVGISTIVGLSFICGVYFTTMVIQVYYYRMRYKKLNSTLMRTL